MKCFHCHKDIFNEDESVLISPDGDFVCNEKCKKEYENERDHFLNVTIHDDILFENWLCGGASSELKNIIHDSLNEDNNETTSLGD